MTAAPVMFDALQTAIGVMKLQRDVIERGANAKAWDGPIAYLEADQGPLAGKTYAELHSVVDALTPALSRHGLSASWKLTTDDKDWMVVTCYLRHSMGHEETASMGGPPDTGGAKNPIQARASTKTYLERYTLKAICGVAEGGDDNDGGTPKQAEDVTEADAEVIQAGRNAAMEGMKPLTAWWGKLDAKTRGKLSKEFGQMRRAAQEADNAR
jgi:hypothetical protein